MPTIRIEAEYLFKELGREYSTDELRDLCFAFGIELEDDLIESPEPQDDKLASKLNGLAISNGNAQGKRMLVIDIPANRYDLLSPEGLCSSLYTFLHSSSTPVYRVIPPASGKLEQITIDASVTQQRPHVVSAILRNITFTPSALDSFIAYQDKLHTTICRHRSLVAIGTHDYDTIKGPLKYGAEDKNQVKFRALTLDTEMTGAQVVEKLSQDRHLSKYTALLPHPTHPIVRDSTQVLSLPPLINSYSTRITLNTKNVLIECTATDLHKADLVLRLMVTSFARYCKEPFTCEPVKIIYPDGTHRITPDLSTRYVTTTCSFITSSIGITLTPDHILECLKKMSLSGSLLKPNSTGKDGQVGDIQVSIPPFRTDILHACDVMEDVAIAYGFNNIPKTMPGTNTIGKPFALNKLADSVRKECALAGFVEVLPLTLCSHDENFSYLRLPESSHKTAVQLANPQTAEYQVVRTSLLPGMLKTIRENKKMPLPLKLFEVGDVVFKDDSVERRAKNQRRVGVVWCGKISGFEFIHGLLDRLMAMLNVPLTTPGSQNGYYIVEGEHPTYFPGRRADIIYRGNKIGQLGIVHPEVLEKFELGYPCTALEFELEHFL